MSNRDSRTETEILYSIIQTGTYIYKTYTYTVYSERDRDKQTEIFRQRKRDIYYNIYTQLKIQLETEISRHK